MMGKRKEPNVLPSSASMRSWHQERNAQPPKQRQVHVESPSLGTPINRIHAFETRNTYQKIVMRFIDWCRDQHGILIQP